MICLNDLNNAIFRIDKSLNRRFEKDEKLYIDKQSKYDIRKKLRNGAWQGIYDGFVLSEGISPDILTVEIIKNSWLINREISSFDYENKIGIIFKNTSDKVFYEAMEEVLNNKISVRDSFRLKLLAEYYSRISIATLKKRIDIDDRNLNIESIASIVLERLFSSNSKIEVKLEYFNKIYSFSNAVSEQVINDKFSKLYKLNKKDINKINYFILKEYIYKNVLNESFWIKVINTTGKNALKLVEKYSMIYEENDIQFDAYVFRSLLNGILKPKSLDKEITSEEFLYAFQIIAENSIINPLVYIECEHFCEKINDKDLREKMLNITKNNKVQYKRKYKPSKEVKCIANIDKILKNPSHFSRNNLELADFISSLLSIDLSSREEARLSYYLNRFENLKLKKLAFETILNNCDVENFEKFLAMLILRSNNEKRDKVIEEIIYRCKKLNDVNLKNSFINFMKDNKLKHREAILCLRDISFEAFIEIFPRI